jgi:excisionase family DNA binding protein
LSNAANVVTESKLLSPSEVAGWLSVSRATVYRLVDAGQIPVVRVGGQLRFDRAELERWLAHAKDAA